MAESSPLEVKLWDEVLDPNSDVTLVSDDGQSIVRVRSKVLSLASPNFAEILDSIGELMRSKGEGLDDSTRYMFIWDKPDPMILILKIVHCKSKDLPSKITMQQLSEIVIFCRKYQLLDYIHHRVSIWIGPLLDDDRTDPFGDI